jgi:hypothetical protein
MAEKPYIKNTPRNIHTPFQAFMPEKAHEYCVVYVEIDRG